MRKPADPVDLNSTVAVTLIMRASQRAQDYGVKLLAGDTTPLSGDEAEEITSADPADRQAVLSFIAGRGLNVTSEDAHSRKICVTGTISQMNTSFGVSMRMKDDSTGHKYLGYDGRMVMPECLKSVVEAVLGLDAGRVAQSRVIGANKRIQGSSVQ